jgi:diadenosine tetraphosphate (Ap4A) HIT family hydrolase
LKPGKIAFRLGRALGKHPLAGRVFCLTERMLPVKRIVREEGLVAFHHPRPIDDPHILIVPTRPFATLTSDRISERQKASIIWQMVQMARRLANQFAPNAGWTLIINGGNRQDIGHVHGHLIQSHSRTNATGRPLQDPELDLSFWNQIFAELGQAERIPDNGFSLEIRSISTSDSAIELSQSVTV